MHWVRRRTSWYKSSEGLGNEMGWLNGKRMVIHLQDTENLFARHLMGIDENRETFPNTEDYEK